MSERWEARDEIVSQAEFAALKKYGQSCGKELKQGGSTWSTKAWPTPEQAEIACYRVALQTGYKVREHWWQVWLPKLPEHVRAALARAEGKDG